MTPASAGTLRRAAAHVLVDDVDEPELADDARHHLFRVLRVRDGDVVTITDGVGRWRTCCANAGSIEPTGPVTAEGRRAFDLTVAVAIPKQDRPEWIVQKLTEIGVERIILLHAGRSIVKWDAERSARHLTKLTRIASEALQQSRGVWLPTVTGPVPAARVLPAAVAAEPGGRALSAGDHTVAIGPEGGWTPDELSMAADTVTVGSTVLRVETAAIVAATLMVRFAAAG